ncbi:PREDICTED: LDLR chaperone MESD [Nanorana parkeri]|uniref:LDLR chaperone MESD n=1 Tax=Nanorana parkeri TaxID=125878 RepID=UPI000854D0AA|nr:PREDICTED: LDLR chaperone MESD [Nanorana parkeri]
MAALSVRSVCVCLLFIVTLTGAAEEKKKKKKDIRDYNDADMARLLDQWEKDDEIEEGDLPEHKRKPAPIDFKNLDPGNPESILQMTKKGKTIMIFATVSGNPTEKETEEITSLWQGSLFNANYDIQRFPVGPNRVIFMLRDGGYAWEVKDFLVGQDRCEDVTLEGQVYPGKRGNGSAKVRNINTPEKEKKKKSDSKKSKSSIETNRPSPVKDDL